MLWQVKLGSEDLDEELGILSFLKMQIVTLVIWACYCNGLRFKEFPSLGLRRGCSFDSIFKLR